ncbi:Copper ABC transporter protein [Salinisphaera shabanensis E1L3A]|uniref:Copper ABC transporter protein n=1 Tax=Salinisphaera shabanensis E1L3A TaxID=1033802 RepID=U2FSS7_9GAMM|nr:ABC transporter ATP-binding protein [Salinisphaera shabanensis]ERJ17493.1 Copper ABC transporter protein [Salinisphaera shabanensis E1L3A]
MSENAIELQSVEKHYRGFTALGGVDLTIERGEMLALLGHNGAGKTTLMKILLGLTRVSAGRVRVLEQPPATSGAVALRAHIGFLPENVVFAGGMTGREILHMFARLKGQPRASADSLLERVGLAGAADGPVRTYSKGMRQRLGLAQALIGSPRLLLLDEPTTGLDPTLRQAFYAILADMQHEGTTILISSHVLTELETRTDRIAIMNRGKLAACNTLDGLYREAGLPVRVRVEVDGADTAARVAQGPECVLTHSDRRVELAIAPADKLATIRRLSQMEDHRIRDLQVFTPSLDAVYDHFGSVRSTSV